MVYPPRHTYISAQATPEKTRVGNLLPPPSVVDGALCTRCAYPSAPGIVSLFLSTERLEYVRGTAKRQRNGYLCGPLATYRWWCWCYEICGDTKGQQTVNGWTGRWVRRTDRPPQKRKKKTKRAHTTGRTTMIFANTGSRYIHHDSRY